MRVKFINLSLCERPRRIVDKIVVIPDPQDVITVILQYISKKDGATKVKRLAYLNAFVKFMQYKKSTATELTFDIERIFIWFAEIISILKQVSERE